MEIKEVKEEESLRLILLKRRSFKMSYLDRLHVSKVCQALTGLQVLVGTWSQPLRLLVWSGVSILGGGTDHETHGLDFVMDQMELFKMATIPLSAVGDPCRFDVGSFLLLFSFVIAAGKHGFRHSSVTSPVN